MNSTGQEGQHRVAEVLERNIRALIERRYREEKGKSLEERFAGRITRFTGSMLFVYIHVLVYGIWILVNVGWVPVLPKFDPTFVILAMVASVEAIFLSTFVLITQNRMAALADKQAQLDLQISLLAEHEVTRIITLVAAIAKRLKIEESGFPELEELEKDIRPETVLEKMEETEKEMRREEEGDQK